MVRQQVLDVCRFASRESPKGAASQGYVARRKASKIGHHFDFSLTSQKHLHIAKQIRMQMVGDSPKVDRKTGEIRHRIDILTAENRRDGCGRFSQQRVYKRFKFECIQALDPFHHFIDGIITQLGHRRMRASSGRRNG